MFGPKEFLVPKNEGSKHLLVPYIFGPKKNQVVTVLGMVTILPLHLGLSYIYELSQYTKSEPPSMPRSALKVVW